MGNIDVSGFYIYSDNVFEGIYKYFCKSFHFEFLWAMLDTDYKCVFTFVMINLINLVLFIIDFVF